MRLSRQIPFQWIVDESRRRRVTETYDTISEALEATAKFYRRNALRETDAHVEIWLEKDALAGALWDVVSDYDVPLLVSRGMQSLTLLHGTAEEIYRAAHLEKATYIYQFGDHDPSGVLIPKTIEKRLTELCEQMDVPRPFVERAALTEAHIDEYDLPTRPTKRDGNTHANSFDGDSVELDALPPKVLRDLVRETIELHISPAKLAVLRTAEGSERELLTRWAGRFDGDAE
jgi:hypothetical protein